MDSFQYLMHLLPVILGFTVFALVLPLVNRSPSPQGIPARAFSRQAQRLTLTLGWMLYNHL
jgi:hypothetical protein